MGTNVKNINKFAVTEAMRMYAVHCTARGQAFGGLDQPLVPRPTWADLGRNHHERGNPEAIETGTTRHHWYLVALDVMNRYEPVGMSNQPTPEIADNPAALKLFGRFMANRQTPIGVSPDVGRENG
jgi:hypothetical protein